jgi:osmotically-inducible protein OsmY
VVTTEGTRTDEQIQQDVLAELKWYARIQPNEIGVAVKDGIAILSGWVDSYSKLWAAERAALRVRGVKGVANEIEVNQPSSAQRTDAEIVAAALDALEWDALIPTEDIKVSVSNGWVTIAGEVQRQYQKYEAERVVRRLTGVRGVTNEIVVQPPSTPSDDLKQAIEEALVRNAEVDSNRIQVTVQGSTAILRGSAGSWAERQEVERVAWSAPGITSVENHIVIKL